MDTQVGKIVVLVNEEVMDCEVKSLPKLSNNFCVNERYKIICNKIKKLGDTVDIKCIFLPNSERRLESSVEAGENLALVSFYTGSTKLSIGTVGDICGIQYKYLNNGLQLVTKLDLTKVVFYIAWVEMTDTEREDIYTWFAADPSYDVN